jgi:hypothetical protein
VSAPAEVLGAEGAAAVERLLARLGLSGAPALERLAGGRNNQVFRVDVGTAELALKVYFRHPGDPRDRLGTEFGFCAFAWDHGVHAVPRPLACDAEVGMALYEFVSGERLRPGEVTAADVQATLDFYQALNRRRGAAAHLGPGSEACFSTAEHLACLQRRVARLQGVTEADVRAFVCDHLQPAADAVAAAVQAAWGEFVLADVDRRVSPSDFGFHNVLRQPDGVLRFLDFEYAGWDDPAKLACDFFCQPAVPVPGQHFASFAATVAADLSDPAAQIARFRALLPVYRLKWCGIMLNDFLPEGGARRDFASETAMTAEARARQLELARAALAGLHEGLDQVIP